PRAGAGATARAARRVQHLWAGRAAALGGAARARTDADPRPTLDRAAAARQALPVPPRRLSLRRARPSPAPLPRGRDARGTRARLPPRLYVARDHPQR